MTPPVPRQSRRRPLTVASAWIAAHTVALLILPAKTVVLADVHYYYRGVHHLQPGAMDEYPEVGTWPARLVDALTWSESSFVVGFLVATVACSGLFTWYLYRAGTGPGKNAVWFWIAFIALSGPIVETRLDIFPGIAVAACAAMLFARRRRVRDCASAVLALATMMKLWPGILAAALVGGLRRSATWIRVGGFIGSLLALCAIVALFCGPERLFSPLSYQGNRGLQIESFAASPLVVAAALLGSDAWDIYNAPSKSIEILGPGVGVALTATTVLTVLTVVAALVWATVRLRADDWTPTLALSTMMLLVLLLIVANKVFSPQYVTWIAPLTAVAVAVGGGLPVVRRIAVGVLVIAALTTLIFPVFYDEIILRPPPSLAASSLLLIRAGVTVLVAADCWRWIRSQRLTQSR